MPLMIAAKPGARPREILVDEAACERLMAELAASLEAIRAAKRAFTDWSAPRGADPLPQRKPVKPAAPVKDEQPLAEWERELLEQQAAGDVPFPCAVVGCGHASQSHWEVTEPDGQRKGCAVLGCACMFYVGAAEVIAESIATGRPVIVADDEIITAPADPGWRDERTGLMSGPVYDHLNRLSCGCTFAGPLTWPAGRKARCDSHGEVTTVDTDPSGDGGEPPAPAELTEDEARQPCDRKACGHERGHHAKGTEECAHGCGCAAYLLPMPAPAAAAETEGAP
jgi:hypothetical protein